MPWISPSLQIWSWSEKSVLTGAPELENSVEIAFFGGFSPRTAIPITLKFDTEEYTVFTLARQFRGGVWQACRFGSGWVMLSVSSCSFIRNVGQHLLFILPMHAPYFYYNPHIRSYTERHIRKCCPTPRRCSRRRQTSPPVPPSGKLNEVTMLANVAEKVVRWIIRVVSDFVHFDDISHKTGST